MLAYSPYVHPICRPMSSLLEAKNACIAGPETGKLQNVVCMHSWDDNGKGRQERQRALTPDTGGFKNGRNKPVKVTGARE